MKNFKFKILNIFLIIFLLFSYSISFAQFGSGLGADDSFDGEITCDLWESYSDVWFANGCDLIPSYNCAPGYYVPPGGEPDECIPLPTGGGGDTNNTSGTGGGGGGSTNTSNLANNNTCSISKPGEKTTIKSLMNYATCIINISIIPFLFAITIIAFLWGVVQFVLNTDNEGEREKGKQFMIWGVIGLTIMITIWGIIAIVGGSFGFEVNFIPQVGN